MTIKTRILGIIIFLILWGCGNSEKETVKETKEEVARDVYVPGFNADSAFYFVKKQTEFGPRVPGTEAHTQAGDYFVAKFESYGANVIEQKFEMTTWDGVKLPLRNIIASFYPEMPKRVLLAAHWDSRPYADKDESEPDKPLMGANDGASGVGVLVEIARLLSQHQPANVGVDIILFDGEDWGEHKDIGYLEPPAGLDSWWCLGSQYWSRNKHKPNYSAYYGILLDMVGAKNSQFHIEGLSSKAAPKVVERVWGHARELGYGSVFINRRKSHIVDDHKFVNEIAKIPMIDIVHYDPEIGYFGDYHHTHRDNMDIIDPKILDIVGETVTRTLFYE